MSRFERLSPLAGFVAVVLWVVGVILSTHNGPPDHATDAQMLAYYQHESNYILTGGFLFMLGTLFFLWFAGILRARLLEAEGAPGTFSAIAFAGAVAGSVFAVAIPLADIAGAVNKNDISAPTAATFHRISDGFFVGAEMMAVLLFAATALLAFRTAILPKWFAALMVLVAIVLIVGPIGWAGLIFGVPIWTLITAVLLLRKKPAESGAFAATAAT
jgi:hypothetical protein